VKVKLKSNGIPDVKHNYYTMSIMPNGRQTTFLFE